MRLWRLELINYIGIYNGMGLKHIAIDFSKCKNRITVIKGDNGSGKSTIFKALNPFSDPSSSLLPEVNASKYIAYVLPDGSILHIHYFYKKASDAAGTRKTTCKVEREVNGNMTLLNPNGNVKEAKDIICDLLDIDAGFMTLAQLSSDDRGLADKTPAERKKYINAKISELEAYNTIYKKITKKSSTLNSILNSLNSKIQAIGDIKSVQCTVDALSERLHEAGNRKDLLIYDISANKVKYDALADKANEVLQWKSELDCVNSEIRSLNLKEPVTEGGVSDAKEILQKTEFIKQSIASDITSINTQRSKVAEKISTKEIKLESIGDTDNLNEILNHIKELKESKAMAHKRFTDMGFDKYADVSVNEYKYAVDIIERIQRMREAIIGKYDSDIIAKVSDMILSPGKRYTRDELERYKTRASQISSIIDENERNIKASEEYGNIPSNCNNLSSCPFIRSIVEAKNNIKPDEDIQKLNNELDTLQGTIKAYTKELDLQEQAMMGMSDISNYINLIESAQSIITKFPVKSCNKEQALNSLVYNSECISINTSPYRECMNLFIDSKSYQNDIDKLEKQYAELSPNMALRNQLEEDLVSLHKEYDEFNDSLSSLNDKYEESCKNEQNFREILSEMESRLEDTKKNAELLDYKKKLQDNISANEDSYNKANQLASMMDSAKASLDKIERDELPSLQDLINKNRYKIVLYNDYVKEYKQYTSEYHRVETIKHYCSPTTGIQTVFMEVYMNKVIGISNQLLSMLFGGEYVLQPFIVNEKEFRMPVLGSGILNDDISSMSTSQVCMISMILSFSLLHQSSSVYNIIKIDELEGGLDTQNRLAFFNVLDNLMSQLAYDQCVMISHNTELNMNSMDVIVLKNTDPSSSFDGNIIFNLKDAIGI